MFVPPDLNEALKRRAFETAQVWGNKSTNVFSDILSSAAGIVRLSGSEAALSRQLQSALASISTADRKLAHLQRTYEGAQKLRDLEQQLRDATIEATESMSRTQHSFLQLTVFHFDTLKFLTGR